MRHRKKIIWGIILILTGVLAAVLALGLIKLPFEITPWRAILGAAVLFALVDGLSRLEFAQAFLMAGIEVIIFEEQIGKLIGKTEADWINNWIVILIAVLIGVGFNMIFGGLRRGRRKKRGKHFDVNVNAFNDNLKYIDASKMKYEYVRNNFGDFEVRFENSDEYAGGAELTIENSFGDVVVYVPMDWEVSVDIDSSFGDVTVDDLLRVQYADGVDKKLVIKGTNRFGDLDIRAQK